MRTSFAEILTENKIVIPILQRDYAQGRTDIKTTSIRENFLDALFDVLQVRASNPKSKKTLELDFIYGFNKQGIQLPVFTPIDGQQRLTTLWLLWWFVAAKENKGEQVGLKNFCYETRHSTTVFCEKLLSFHPDFCSKSISSEIKDQPWYFENWDFDPGICAMLVMLDDVEQRYLQLGGVLLWDLLNDTDSPFFFYKLDMGEVGLPDDLYIKMNSRGKPLTEFEYFKANFSGIITEPDLKERFQKSIDQEWAETIWKIVCKSEINGSADIAVSVDNGFIRLINFITDIIAYKQNIPFEDVSKTFHEAKLIYEKIDNLLFLFDTLDAIVEFELKKPDFFEEIFYLEKSNFVSGKTRLFFQNAQENLLEKCILKYEKSNRDFSFPEQIVLYSCIIHWLKQTKEFKKTVRIIRNLAVNSSNELRVETIGRSFTEVERFVLNNRFEELINFKTDQIAEERNKQVVINTDELFSNQIAELEDSDLMRGCISIFDLDSRFEQRAKCFLRLFDEDAIVVDFPQRANFLLCFGDYGQDDGGYTNLLSKSRLNWRTFLTTPAFNKNQLISKTKPVLMNCLDFSVMNESIGLREKINDELVKYDLNPKDWKYYFLKYPGFRLSCNKGYYYWNGTNHYPLFKMKEKQFNGYHWDPFLIECRIGKEEFLKLDNGGKMQFLCGSEFYFIESRPEGFELFQEEVQPAQIKIPVTTLRIRQNSEGIDLEDRIQALNNFIDEMLAAATSG